MPSKYQTYVKQLHSNADAGLFLADYAAITSQVSAVVFLGLLLHQNRLELDTAPQDEFGINKRHAAEIIAFIEGKLKSAEERKSQHLAILKSKIKSFKSEIDSLQKKIDVHKSYLKAVAEANHKISKRGRGAPLPLCLFGHPRRLTN